MIVVILFIDNRLTVKCGVLTWPDGFRRATDYRIKAPVVYELLRCQITETRVRSNLP